MSSDRTARSLFLALALIVSSFVAATAYTHLRANDIDRLANEITRDASPSIRELSEVRMEVRHLEVLLLRYIDEARAGVAAAEAARSAVEQARRSYGEHIFEYQQLPVMPGERDIWRDVSQELRAFDDVVARTMTLVDLDQVAAAEALVSRELSDHADSATMAIARSIDFNARGASEAASAIRRTRSRMGRVAFALDVVCAVLACGTGVLVLRTFHRYTNLLETQRVELERRNGELEQFAGRVAHDIVSPLATAVLALDFGEKRAEASGQHARLFASGKRSIMRVRRVVDGLLEFARAGARPSPDAQAALGEVLEDVLAGHRSAATDAGIELIGETEYANVSLRCSPGALTSVLSNLIGNAIKYIGEGPVRRIVVRCRAFEHRARVEVHDTGPGLPPNLERDIFEPYVRGAGSNQPGMGLGLATVSRIVRSHGGVVGVRSTPGKGCSFWFDLPYAARVTPSMVPPSRPSTTSMRLIIAGEDAAHVPDADLPKVGNRQSSEVLTGGVLRNAGHSTTESAPRARDAAAEDFYDCGRRAGRDSS